MRITAEEPTNSARTFRGFPILVRQVRIGGRAYRLLGPANYNDLPDSPSVAERFERDEYMPYWADLWPGALMLAHEVARWPRIEAECRPVSVLELGCGLGLVGLVAANLGYRVCLSDYDEDALAFALQSAELNGIARPETKIIDWRVRYPDLKADRILAADVLYETRNLAPIADFVCEHLSDRPGSMALISDPNRSTAEAFDSIARHSGLTVEILPANPVGLAGARVAGRVFRLRRRTASAAQ